MNALAEAEPRRVRLTQLARGAVGRLEGDDPDRPGGLPVGLPGGLDADAAEQLRAMGLRAGCRLRVCKVGQPCIVALDDHSGGCRIALSRDLAGALCVVPC